MPQPRNQGIAAQTVARYEVEPWRGSSEYAEGFTRGEDWAREDRANSISAAPEVELLRAETQSDQRWARAFYLGALRGYRSVARTLKAGRWGL